MVFGEAKYWVKKAEIILKAKLGINLYYGTLNVELQEEYILGKNVLVIHKEEYGGSQEVYIKPCTVFNGKAYIVRTDKNSSINGDYPLNLIEIISDINFRKKYNLKNGDKIEIEV